MRIVPDWRVAVVFGVAVVVLPAQHPPLAPTANTTIATGGVLHYSSILVPAGVTVQFTGSAPAVVVCHGDCIVHGTLSVAAAGLTSGPGSVTIGQGSTGSYCPGYCAGGFGCACLPHYTPSGNGQHHGLYGTWLPFGLEGGSPGGAEAQYSSSNPFFSGCCDQFTGFLPGGAAGGTLVLLAEGRIEVGGTIDADGASSWTSIGAAGAVLLRGAAGVQILPSGQVLGGPPGNQGGRVRLDAWGAPPDVQGVIAAPPATVLELPYLHIAAPPGIGSVWSVEVYAPANSDVFLAAATLPGFGSPTPFGPLQIDLSRSTSLGSSVVPVGSHDPAATFYCSIPNAGALLGLQLWLQGLAAPPALPPRLTNGVATIVS
jgi:hypothetical protein